MSDRKHVETREDFPEGRVAGFQAARSWSRDIRDSRDLRDSRDNEETAVPEVPAVGLTLPVLSDQIHAIGSVGVSRSRHALAPDLFQEFLLIRNGMPTTEFLRLREDPAPPLLPRLFATLPGGLHQLIGSAIQRFTPREVRQS
jgi:hypothetical protein